MFIKSRFFVSNLIISFLVIVSLFLIDFSSFTPFFHSFIAALSAQNTTVGFYLEQPQTTYTVGDNISVQLKLNNPSPTMNTIQADISYPDGYNPRVGDLNLGVDKIIIDGVTIETERPTTY